MHLIASLWLLTAQAAPAAAPPAAPAAQPAAPSPVGAPRAPARPTEPLSLSQAIQRAATGNADLRRERIAIEQAEAGVTAALGQFDLRLTGRASFQASTTPPLNAGDIAGGTVKTTTLDLGLARNLETGGQIRIGAGGSGSDTTSRLQCGVPLATDPVSCIFYRTDLELSFSHPLLQGFGTDVAMANLRRRRIQQDQALLARQMRVANVVRDVVTIYWQLAFATRDLAIAESGVELAREQLRATQAQIDAGRLAPVDAAAVERAIGERLQAVKSAEEAVLFRTLQLRRLFGMPIEARAPLFTAVDAPAAGGSDVNVEAELHRALETNPQLRALRLGLRLTEIDLATAESTLRPRLDFVGSIGAAGRDRDLGEAIRDAASFDRRVWSAGLVFDVPLQNRAAEGSTRAANLGIARAQLDAQDLELSLRELVIRTASSIRLAGERLELAKATLGFAQTSLEAEQARFAVGRSTNHDVLLRQQELKAAEVQVVRATVELLIAQVTLDAVTGEVLDRYGVALKG